MKLIIASVLLAAIGANAIPNPQTVCAAVCRTVKPICPKGQVAGGSEGCWGCCQPIPTACLDICRPKKPVCPAGQAPTGKAGCWGCCQPIRTIIPLPPKPTPRPCAGVACLDGGIACPDRDAVTGAEGCGCCRPLNNAD